MGKIIFICFTICFVSVFAFAQNQPFYSLEKAVKEQRGGFNGNKENLSVVFNQERIRLGENFDTELWKYLGNDVGKYYWIGFFLQSKSYLHGNQPLPELALEVWQNGLKLLEAKQDEEIVGDRFKILILSAVLAEKLGKKDLAADYKKQTEAIASSGFDTKVYLPFMYEYERCIYYSIGTINSGKCRPTENEQPKELAVLAGVLNGKAVKLAKPKYPKEARKQKISGQVSVKVLIDIDGKVISAEAVKGPTELFGASVEAAKKSRFSPTTLSGKPVRVSGTIIYDFVR